MQTEPSPPARLTPPRRFVSVDALRGFDMLWIVGAGGLVGALDKMAGKQGSGLLHFLAQQLSHKEWEGFAFEDLIFPLFVFLVGVSIVFSLTKTLAGGEGKTTAYKRIGRRFLLMYAVALVYSGGVSKEWPDIRLMGVLNRIALCYLFTSLAFLHLKTRGLVALVTVLLGGYWALLAAVPFPDLRTRDPKGVLLSEQITAKSVTELNWGTQHTIKGVYQPGLNLTHYLDQKYLPGKKWNGTWDPEGFLSTLPAIATCLLGVFAGLLIQNQSISDQKKVQYLLMAGVGALAWGFLWGAYFPIVKKIWSSSFVLVAGGYSALLLGAFYQIIEVWGYQRWAQPFVWVGSNAITIYLANNLIHFREVSLRFTGGDVMNFLNEKVHSGVGDLLAALVTVGIGLALVRFLYQRKIFLRL